MGQKVAESLIQGPVFDPMLTLNDLAKYTAFSEQYWYNRISSKKMPFPVYRFGRSVKFMLSDVNKWIEAHKVRDAVCKSY
jgi:excisionase family DNA binding protein